MKVLTVIDSLIAAGAERMAVNIANGLARNGIKSYLCATHSGGPLADFVDSDVDLFILDKKHSFDLSAFFRLKKYVKSNQIDIVHAHSSSIYWAVALKLALRSKIKVVWHDHYGLSEHLHKRSLLMLKLASPFFDHSFVVNDKLLNFAIGKLRIARHRVSFLPNFADLKIDTGKFEYPDMPGRGLEPKIVCLANLRRQKDHHNLLDAFSVVRDSYPNAALYLVGGHFGDGYHKELIKRSEAEENLKRHVFILGSRNDVAQILNVCTIGVLSSLSEGLPVSLLEYGLAGLPVVCTKVGDCSFVLDDGKYGKLVPPMDSMALANAIVEVLNNPEESEKNAASFQEHVHQNFSNVGAIKKISEVYLSIIKDCNELI